VIESRRCGRKEPCLQNPATRDTGVRVPHHGLVLFRFGDQFQANDAIRATYK